MYDRFGQVLPRRGRRHHGRCAPGSGRPCCNAEVGRSGPFADSAVEQVHSFDVREALEETMLMELEVNGHASRIASVAELRQKLAPFACNSFGKCDLALMLAGQPCLRF
jgi:hypothetical protein